MINHAALGYTHGGNRTSAPSLAAPRWGGVAPAMLGRDADLSA